MNLFWEIFAQNLVKLISQNNAGITRDNLLMRMKDDGWNDIIETNLSSVFRLSKSGNARYDEKASWTYYHHRFCGLGTMGNAGQSQLRAAAADLIGFSINFRLAKLSAVLL